jgi:hypothetical protein
MPAVLSLVHIARELDRDAEEFDSIRRRETDSQSVLFHAKPTAVRVVRLLLAARKQGARLPGLLPIAADADQTASDEELLLAWKWFVTPWLRAVAPECCTAGAGDFDFPAVKTNRDGTPAIRKRGPLKGRAIRVSEDYSEPEALRAARARVLDWANATRVAAVVLRQEARIGAEKAVASIAQPDALPTIPPPGGPQVGGLALTAFGFSLDDVSFALSTRPRDMLKILMESKHRDATADRLRQGMRVDDEAGAIYPEQVVKDTAKRLRKALREAGRKVRGDDFPDNPLPSTGRKADLAYRLALE